jgi:RimJ/RimL family protein N-acetyltransferase
MVEAWADTIVDAWLAAHARAALDVQQPLLIFDLEPGQGRLAVQLLRRVQQRLSVLGYAHWCVRYCALAPQREAREALREHAPLQAFFANGWFSVLSHWPSGKRHNPVVALSLGGFGRCVPQIYGVHYGAVFGAAVTARPLDAEIVPGADQGEEGGEGAQAHDDDAGEHAAAPPPRTELTYAWSAIEPPGEAAAWLAFYTGRLNSAPLSIAPQALAQLDALEALSGGRYLLLALDLGAACEQDLREGALAPPSLWHDGMDRLRVNFDLLTRHQQARAVQVRNLMLESGGWVLHAALSGWPLELDELVERLEAAHPDHLGVQRRCAVALAEAADPAEPASLDTAALLGALRASAYDPLVLQTMLPALIELAPPLDACQVRDWRVALERTWRQAEALAPAGVFRQWLATLALNLGYAGLARTVLEHVLHEQAHDQDALYLLAYCEAVTGRIERAIELLQAHPGEAAQRLLPQLLERLAARAPGYAFHLDALLVQYRDREIGIAARLPELDSAAAAHAWLEREHAEGRCMHYAVMHRDWGLVGATGLSRIDDMAFFHFWIGVDFQGRGFGRAAARLSFEQARLSGIAEIFTSVYPDNRRSCTALEAIGMMPFIDLDNQAQQAEHTADPQEPMQRYRYALSDAVGWDGAFERMQRLSAQLDRASSGAPF